MKKINFLPIILSLGSAFLALVSMPVAANAQCIVSSGSIDERVAAGSDDASQIVASPFTTTTNGSGVALMSTANYAGFRFTTVNIPQGATITSAYVEFTASATASTATNPVTIKGQNIGTAPTFAASASNISGRATTTASASWTPGNWTSGTAYQTSSITSIIQEIVNRGDWAANNDLVLTFLGTSGTNTRTAHTFESSTASTQDPRLVVNWQVTSNISVAVTSAVPTACNAATNKYDLAVTVAYSNPPTGDMQISVGDFGTYFFFTPDGTSPDTYTITGLTASGIQNLDVKANFVAQPACSNTLVDAYDAPASCGNYCSGNMVQNPSFETVSGGGTPPIHAFYTPASWTTNANTCYGESDWLLPDGVGFLSLSGVTNTTASQNIPVTVGNPHELTFYSAMHFPFDNNATATIQYYNASNVALGTAAVHTVTHDWENDHTLGGPYTLTLGAAPAGTSYLRITLQNNSGSAPGESIKFDAFCLSVPPCEILLTTNVSGCFDSNGNTAGGSSVATVQAIVDWAYNPSGETINVSCTGAATQSINPATSTKPAVLNFQVPANGAGLTIAATFSTSTSCSATETETAPAGNCLLTPCVSGNTGGQVWQDFDGDGLKDASETAGIGGVTVTAFDCNGTAVATTTTDYLGQYFFTALTFPNTYRIEFSGLPANFQPTSNGTDGRTDVQFISAAECNVDFGASNPVDYCQTNPQMATNCYVNGNNSTGSSGAGDVLVKFLYNNTGTTPAPTSIGIGSQAGTTWGLAYQKGTGKLFSSAYLKRHAGFGPLGTGGIYVTDIASGATTSFVNLNGLAGISTGTDPHTDLVGDKTLPSQDSVSFNKVGKLSFGDMDISDDGKTLFVVNLHSRQIHKIFINSPAVVPTASEITSFNIPNPCGNNDYRPFALKYHNGKVYVGLVCSAESTQDRTDLEANIYEMDAATGVFGASPVLSFPLDFTRGRAWNPTASTNKWFPWLYDWTLAVFDGANSVYTYPQPMLSDIEFDADGAMVLGFRDRLGDQLGVFNYFPNGNSMGGEVVTGGDIMRAAGGNGHWLIESNGVSGTLSSGAANGQGIGGSEFYKGDAYSGGEPIYGHEEISNGGLAILRGSGEMAMTALDPQAESAGFAGFNSAGIRFLSNTNGAFSDGYQVYDTDSYPGTFQKSGGLGDVELLCNPAPLQIGNYVWIDTDKDGVQDACENALSGVKVRLYKGTTLIAETTTSATGEYYFSSASKIGTGTWSGTGADTTLLASTAYRLVFGKSATDQWSNTTNYLTVGGVNYSLTVANTGQGTNPDLNDSDAAEASVSGIGLYPMILVTTGALGSVNHTYDVGLTSCALTTACDIVVNPVRITMRTTDITTPDTEGRTFLSYQKFDLPGDQLSNTNTITNLNTGAPNGTSSQELYRNRLAEDYIDWHFAVPNGSYTVLLHYAEGGVNAANARLFDVYIENTKVENNFDTWVQAGNAQNRALVKSYSTTVADNDLGLRFEREVNTIVVRGVEIIPNFCTATQAVTIASVDVSGCYRNGSGQSKSTVSVEVAWDNALPRDSIAVTLGAQTKWIFPGQYNTTGGAGTIVSPQVVAFEIDANGSAGTVTATMFNNNDCSDTEPFTAPAACPATTCTAGQLGGTVFNDYDADGVKDAGETNGASGVTVTVFDCNGNTATATTDADGKWVVSSALTYPVRVEYSNLPSYLGDEGTPNGTDGRTTVQFVSAADCNVDLGVLNPSDYCQDAPNVFLPCYVNGDPLPGGSAAGAMDAFVRLTYGATGLTPTITHVANASEVGSLWGVAYDKKRNKVYSSAILRRHSGLGPLGLGGIYQTNATTNATTTLVDVQGTLGVNLGGLSGGPFSGVTNTSRGLLADPTQPTHDSLALSLIGKVGFGDLEISEDNDNLYFVNLYAKTLCRLDLTGGSPVLDATFAIPSPCANGNARPFALKVKDGIVYVGVVCDGATSQSLSDLRAYVYGFDEATSTFSAVFDFPLTYPKGYPDHSVPMISNWNAWADDFEKLNSQTSSGANLRVLYPQPILSDIEVDIDGSMLMAFADRTGLQTGANNYAPATSNTTLYSGYAGGDILRAAKKGNAFILESNAYVGGITGANPNNNQGPGFGEFYNDDFYSIYATGKPTHSEIALGALALKPGSGHSLFTVMDPIDSTVNSGGFRYISNTNGSSPSGAAKGALIYQSVLAGGVTPATFAKSVGLGDMELTCALPTYLQIGNYVWIDTDKDGVQDACESALPGVKVALYKDVSGTLSYLANTTTGANGEYYFTGIGAANENWTATSGYDSLTANTSYKIVFGWDGTTAQFAAGKLTISGTNYELTDADSGEGTNLDLNDSDASLMTVSGNSYPSISLTTGAVGSVNHTYDAGFFPACDITVVSATPSACETATNSYSLSVVVSYANGPTGNINITTSNGASISVAQTSSPQTIVLPTLTSNGVQDIDVTAIFANQTGCTNTALDIYDAPASCWICAGNLLVNPSFEIGALNTTPPTGWSGDGQIAGNNMNEPHGTQYAFATFPGTVLYQDVATTPGYTFNLTFYSGSHNPGVQTVSLRYLDASLTTIGSPAVHNVTYDTDVTSPQNLGGPYSLTLGAAPAGTAFVRVEANNNNVDFVKVDAFCLTGTPPPCVLPVPTLTQTAPTCTSGTPNNDGKITLTAISSADKFGVSAGATYSGTPGYTAATAIGSLPQDLQTAIPNTGGTYTIRFFNGSNTCFKDTTVVVAAAPCACALSATVSNYGCSAEGTVAPGDDKFSFDLTVTGGTGPLWISYQLSGVNGAYGVPKNLDDTNLPYPYFLISNGNYSVTVSDINNSGCSTTINVVPPAPCSPTCPWQVGTGTGEASSTIVRDDNGTPADPSDDSVSGVFSLLVPSNGQWLLAVKEPNPGLNHYLDYGPFPPSQTTVSWGPVPIADWINLGQNGLVLWYMLDGFADCTADLFENFPPVCIQPAGIALSQTAPTCAGGTANNDGKITLTAISNADKFGVSTGASYTGPAYASATAIGSLPQDLQTAIPNTGGAYTVRFFNGANDCYKDTTITIAQVCCPIAGSDVVLTCPPGGGPAGSTYDFNLTGTWTILSQPSGTASVDGNGLVTGMTEVGEYNFQVMLNGCSDTVKITVPACCPVPVCLPVKLTKQD